jgi:hypothetical protein
MGALLSLLNDKKHTNVDLKCKGCECHTGDSSSSEEPEHPKVVQKKDTASK